MGPMRTRPESFREMVVRLTAEKGISVSRLGNEAWRHDVKGTSPDTLKKAMQADNPRRPPPTLLTAVARVLGVPPESFTEYRLAALRRLLDERPPPDGVGLEEAARNLEAMERALAGDADAEARTLAHDAREALAGFAALVAAAEARDSAGPAGRDEAPSNGPGAARPSDEAAG